MPVLPCFSYPTAAFLRAGFSQQGSHLFLIFTGREVKGNGFMFPWFQLTQVPGEAAGVLQDMIMVALKQSLRCISVRICGRAPSAALVSGQRVTASTQHEVYISSEKDK